MTTLKGMTWTHPRGFEPLAASTKEERPAKTIIRRLGSTFRAKLMR